MEIEGRLFHYILCGQPDSAYTLVYLVGGSGNPSSWYRHVLAMECTYCILLCDYPMGVDEIEPMGPF